MHRLSVRLREGTIQQHRAAERTLLIQRLIQGTISVVEYTRYLQQYLRVYRALEGALDANRSHSLVGSLYLPELFRSAAIESDLAAFGVSAPPEASLATQSYVARIVAVSADTPVLLIAHAYARYLGDLSGGQILQAAVARMFSLNEEGVAFYRFPDITDLPAFKAGFRSLLDSLPLGHDMVEAIVYEAKAVFIHNIAVLEALELHPGHDDLGVEARC